MKKLKAKDDKEFEEIIKSQGLTIEGVRKRLREQLMVQRVIRRKVALRISVTEQEIDKYLVDNREKLETGLTFAPRHILVVPDPNKGEEGWLEARKKAEDVYALLLEGQDFGELAKKFSEDPSGKDGGGLGNIKRGELAPDIEEAIMRLQPGEVSTPVPLPGGVPPLQARLARDAEWRLPGPGAEPGPRHPLPPEVRRATQGLAGRDQAAGDHRRSDVAGGRRRAEVDGGPGKMRVDSP